MEVGGGALGKADRAARMVRVLVGPEEDERPAELLLLLHEAEDLG